MQMHLTECGAACLASVLAYFGRWVPLNELRNSCGVSRDGSTAAGLARAAKQYGLSCVGKSVNVKHLKNMPLPQVLFWEWNHFLILEGFDDKRVFLNDPAMGRRKISLEQFAKSFSGISLHFSPTPEFQPGGVPPGMFRRLPVWFQDSGIPLAYVLACGVMMGVVMLLGPVMLSLFVNRILGGTEQWGILAAIIVAIAAVLVFGLSWLKQQCMVRLSARMSVTVGNRCLTKMFRLPVEYFNHRLAGDLTDRILSIDKISNAIQTHFVGPVIELVMSVIFLIAMFAYDTTMALVVLGLGVLSALVGILIERVRTEQNHMMQREQSMLIGIGMLMLHQADNLRMTASEGRFFSRWSGYQARELSTRQRFVEVGHMNAAVPGLFLILAHAAVLAIGAVQVMNAEMSLGTLAAIFVLAGMFLAPIARLAEFSDSLQALAGGLLRLEDIMAVEEDVRFERRDSASGVTATLNGRLKLSGHVELRNVSFGYDRGRQPLIKDFNLVIKPGQRVAVIGASGAGKSTLAALVVGAYEPWSGEILFDGHVREEIPDEVIVRSLSVVEQKPILFSATIRENITLWNTAVPDSILVAAARDACIHEQILERPLGYEARVVENGDNFSGGEGQRLEIARALVGNPTVLVLDEATSALDAATEKAVDDALRHRGVSCLVVAHRLSTIVDCDEIVVLENGITVQRGIHDDLIADKDGLYYRLIKAA